MKRSDFFKRTGVGALALFLPAPAFADAVEPEVLAAEPTTETLRVMSAASGMNAFIMTNVNTVSSPLTREMFEEHCARAWR